MYIVHNFCVHFLLSLYENVQVFFLYLDNQQLPNPRNVIGNFKGSGFQKPKFFWESLKLNWNFQRGGSNQKHFYRGVWIFSGTTHPPTTVLEKGHVDEENNQVVLLTWYNVRLVFLLENSHRFKNIVHQLEVWHGGECKKLNTVSTTIRKHQ